MPARPEGERIYAEFEAALAESSVNSPRAKAIQALTPPDVHDEMQRRLAQGRVAQRRPREQP